MKAYEKPLPNPTAETQPFWDYAKKHELRMQKCTDCGHIRWPAGTFCPKCLSDKAEWVKLSGKGKVYTFGITHYIYDKGFTPEVPYVIAVIEVEEGPRLIGNITGIKHEDIKVNMPVQVYFEDITPEYALPKWRAGR